MFRNLYKLILSFDAVGPRPELNYKGNSRYSSIIGVILTISAFFLALVTIKFTLISFHGKINPDVFITENFDEDRVVNLNNTNYQFFINVVYLDNKTFEHVNINLSEYQSPHILYTEFDGMAYNISRLADMVPCEDEMFMDYNSGFFSPNLYTQEEVKRIKSFSLCLSDSINLSLKSRSNRKDLLQIAFPFESYKNLIKRYDIVGVMLNYKQTVLNPNKINNFYSELWKQEIYYIDLHYLNYHRLDLENYSILKDNTMFLFSNEEEKQIVNGKKFYLWMNLINKRLPWYDYASVIIIAKLEMSTNALIKYKSFNDVLSGFGGSFEIIRVLFEFMGIQIMKSFYYTSIINKMFKFHESRMQGQNANKIIYRKNISFEAKNTKTNDLNNNHINNNNINDQLKIKNFPSITNNEINTFNRKIVELENSTDRKSFRSNLGVSMLSRCSREDKDVKLRYENYLKNRKIKKIGWRDYFMYSLSSSCFKYIPKNNIRLKCKILDTCYKLIERNSDLSNLLKLGTSLDFIKKLLFLKNERNILNSLSLNINNSKSLKFLDKFLNFEIEDRKFKYRTKIKSTEEIFNNNGYKGKFFEILDKYFLNNE